VDGGFSDMKGRFFGEKGFGMRCMLAGEKEPRRTKQGRITLSHNSWKMNIGKRCRVGGD